MYSIYCYDNSLQEIFKCPTWLKQRYSKAEYYFKKNGLYYILEQIPLQPDKVKYLIQGKIYKASIVGTEQQIEVLKCIHNKTDGYKKISIFECM